MATPEPGRVRLRERIGTGAFSTVWLGWDPELDAPVAVKILADNWAARADVRERFLAEGRLLRKVDSDRLVRVYDVGELEDGRPYLVMTYAAGGALADLLAEGPLDTADARAVLAAVAEGLSVLHRQGIVHRDLNPNNILLLTGDPAADLYHDVVLADLGLAKEVAAASGLTQPAGTGAYMAPEQLEYSDRIGPATDVYAYAVLARQLLGPATGVLSGPQAALLAAATDPDPDERPALTDLARAVVGGTGRTGPATTVVLPQVAESGAAEPKVRATPPVERHVLRRWVPAVAGATALAVALGGYAAATRLGLLGAPAPGPAPTAGAAGSPQATAPSVVTTVPGSVVPSVATPSSTDSSTASPAVHAGEGHPRGDPAAGTAGWGRAAATDRHEHLEGGVHADRLARRLTRGGRQRRSDRPAGGPGRRSGSHHHGPAGWHCGGCGDHRVDGLLTLVRGAAGSRTAGLSPRHLLCALRRGVRALRLRRPGQSAVDRGESVRLSGVHGGMPQS